MAASEIRRPPRLNHRWVHRGGGPDALLRASPEPEALGTPLPDEIIAAVEAVSICSSDLKVLRMGDNHPLIAGASPADGGAAIVLGHELCLRVIRVGARQAGRFRPGQRLGLQPAMRVGGRRRTIGFDLPGGFAQYLRLGPEALAAHVFEVPESLTAAEIALLEPYGCVERAYRANARTELAPEGSALVVLGPGAGRHRPSRALRWRRLAVVEPAEAALPDWLDSAAERVADLDALAGARFDDILAVGDIDGGMLARLPAMLADGGLLLQARQTALPPIPIDLARVHYDAITLAGTDRPDLLDALRPDRLRFETRPGGVALVHGAGGAMGRIHLHRLLELEHGPARVIATSRSAARIASLESDFGPMARERGRELRVIAADRWHDTVAACAPRGVDDAIVVVPGAQAVAEAARHLAPDGMLVVFAGFPYGQPVPLDLAGIAVTGRRLTGSTGCSVADMQDVLDRVMRGGLDLLGNLKAVCGLNHLPAALRAVDRGDVSGKIVIYPHAPELPLQMIAGRWTRAREAGLLRGVVSALRQEGDGPCATM